VVRKPCANTLVNQGNTIQGQGNILNLSNFTNQATVNANVSGGMLNIFVPTTNTGTLEATGGGILNIAGSTVTNTGATISTDSTSMVYINNSTIIGGNLTSASGAEIHSIGNSALNGVTITSGSTYSVDAGTNNSLTGDLTNKGTVLIGGSGGNGNILVEASTVNLSGGGTVILNNAGSEINGSSNTLVNKDNTIQGQGYIINLSNFTNQATVNANVLGGALSIGVPITNTGILEATGGGTLSIGSTFTPTVTNTNGTIYTDGSSKVYINSAAIIGGNLTSASGAEIHGLSGTALNGVTITSGSTYSVDAGQSNHLTGDLINQGTVLIGGSSGGSTLYIDASTVNLSGGGTVILNNAGSEINGHGTNTLVNKDNTTQGQGSIISTNFTNQATVNANVSGGTLSIFGPTTTNTGTLEATGGGMLSIVGTIVTNTNGTIYTDGSSMLSINGSTIIGGNLTSASGAEIHGINDATLQGVTITSGSTYSVDAGNSNHLTGDLINQGTVLIGGSSGANLYVDASTVNLSGGGTVILNNASSEIIGHGTNTLVNQDNTIQGQGTILNLASFQNQGTVLANVSGGTLSISNAPTTNSGTFQVNQGSTLQVSGSFTTTGTVNIGALTDTSASLFQMLGGNDYVQTGGTTSLWSAQSTLAVATGQSVNIQGGLLQGFGTITGNLSNTGGTIMPGIPGVAGILTVAGNYGQASNGTLDIQIGGANPGTGTGYYSQLRISGTASLSGLLDVSLVNGFSPVNDEIFVILTSGFLNSGMFTDNTIQVGGVTFDVEYSPAGYTNDVVLEAQVAPSAVPEPASWLMLGLGLTAVGTCVVRKSKSQVRGK